jgi:uncharacterized protein
MRLFTIVLSAMMLALCIPSTQAQQENEELASKELWFGVLEAGGRKLRFALELSEKDDAWTGELLSLDEGGMKFPLSSLEHSDASFAFKIKSSSGSFEGKPDEAGTVIEGHWLQRSAKIPLVFKRVEEIPQAKLKTQWVGQLSVVFQKLDVVFREFENGEMLFDSVTQRASGFVATKKEDGDDIQIDVPGVNGTFKGKYNQDKTQIDGTWSQGIVALTLVLKKSEDAIVQPSAPQRPQTPQPPFPYDIEEFVVTNKAAEGVKLAGTLTLPTGKEPVPVVVMISGSGPQDRNESILDHKPFWVIADHLTRNGVAVLRCDDRGVGESTGDFGTATSVDFASDVVALVEFLSSHKRIDSKQIGLCGHSEGGIIAPLVAAENKNIAFVVMLAGPGVDGDKILSSQSRLILEAAGAEPAEVERQSKMQRIFLDLAQQLPALEEEGFVNAALAQIDPLLTEAERTQGEYEQNVLAAAKQLRSPWFQYFLDYDPAPTLKQLRCPVLALFGSKDLQVDPLLNIPPIKAALSTGGNQDFEVVVLPDLNHLFQKCTTGNIDEYQTIEETFNPIALDKLTSWILKHVH